MPRSRTPSRLLPLCMMFPAGIALADPAATGLRELHGKHLQLATDVRQGVPVDDLCPIFDQAVGEWCRYFNVSADDAAEWKVRGCLMSSPERFRAAGLLPGDLPAFRNGYSRHDDIWFYDQTSDYYRRHLLLHEGTHAFMQRFLPGVGPPWYSEGMAEFLGTHSWDGKRLRLGYYPQAQSEVSKWGRIEIMQRGFAAGKAKRFDAILNYGSRAHLENEPYGWCWGAAAFLEGDPRFHDRFRQVPALLGADNFNERFRGHFGKDWQLLQQEWQVFVANVDYAYDFERMQTRYEPARRLANAPSEVRIAADRGWQPTGVRLDAGQRYQLRAHGRYQIADKPRIWWCEPGGVTIDYWHGLPLGLLQAAVVPDSLGMRLNPLVRPEAVGLQKILAPSQTGTLYLRVNDGPGHLQDNRGTVTVEIQAAVPAEVSPK